MPGSMGVEFPVVNMLRRFCIDSVEGRREGELVRERGCVTIQHNYVHVHLVASFPDSPPRERVYCVTFDLHEKSGGEPGEFYHVSDVKSRENLIGCRRAYRSVLHRPHMQARPFPVRSRSY